MHPSFIRHLWLISQFELNRLVATRKGLLNLVTFAVVWLLILLYPLQFAASALLNGKQLLEDSGILAFFGFESLQHWRIPEFGVYWHIALFLFPLLSISLAADQTCSDRARGTLRFILLRSSRERLFLGRFAGVMLIQLLYISATALTTLALVLYRDNSLFYAALPVFFSIIFTVTLAVLPFTALMAALSATVKSARQATVWAILIWTFLSWIISGLAYYLPVLRFFNVLIPGYQLTELTQGLDWQTMQLVTLPVLQTLALLVIGRWIMNRQPL